MHAFPISKCPSYFYKICAAIQPTLRSSHKPPYIGMYYIRYICFWASAGIYFSAEARQLNRLATICGCGQLP